MSMFYRKKEVLPDKFVGIRFHIFVEEPWENTIVERDTVDFDVPARASDFYQELLDTVQRAEGLKYILHHQDRFERVEVYEHTPEGQVFELGWTTPA